MADQETRQIGYTEADVASLQQKLDALGQTLTLPEAAAFAASFGAQLEIEADAAADVEGYIYRVDYGSRYPNNHYFYYETSINRTLPTGTRYLDDGSRSDSTRTRVGSFYVPFIGQITSVR